MAGSSGVERGVYKLDPATRTALDRFSEMLTTITASDADPQPVASGMGDKKAAPCGAA